MVTVQKAVDYSIVQNNKRIKLSSDGVDDDAMGYNLMDENPFLGPEMKLRPLYPGDGIAISLYDSGLMITNIASSIPGPPGEKGDVGEQGIPGGPGADGAPGLGLDGLASLDAFTVEYNEPPIVTLENKTLAFFIPRGYPGAPGAPGTPGIGGVNGVSGTIINSVTVSTLGPGAVATVSYTDDTATPSPYDKKLAFAIPRGNQGTAGTSATVTVGTVTTSTPGSDAVITNVGTVNDAKLNFTLPRGFQGNPGTAGVQGNPGTAGVQGNPGTAGVQGAVGLPGPQGETGPSGLAGPQGDPGENGTNGGPGLGLDGLLSLTAVSLNYNEVPTVNLESNSMTFGIPQGYPGEVGPQGYAGADGAPGLGLDGLASLDAFTVEHYDPPIVTLENKTLAFFIPRGYPGAKGDQGEEGPQGIQGPQGVQSSVPILTVEYQPRELNLLTAGGLGRLLNITAGVNIIRVQNSSGAQFALSTGTTAGLIQPLWTGTVVCRVTALVNVSWLAGPDADQAVQIWFQDCGTVLPATNPPLTTANTMYGMTVANLRNQPVGYGATYASILPLVGGRNYGLALSTVNSLYLTGSVYAWLSIEGLNA